MHFFVNTFALLYLFFLLNFYERRHMPTVNINGCTWTMYGIKRRSESLKINLNPVIMKSF